MDPTLRAWRGELVMNTTLRKSELFSFVAGAGLASLAWAWYCARSQKEGRTKSKITPQGFTSADRQQTEEPIFVGVDLGGTNVKMAVVDDHGRILQRRSSELGDDRSFDSVTSLIISELSKLVADAGLTMDAITAIGMGAPGNLDCKRGVVLKAAAFDWEGVPLTETIQKATGRPTCLENDANAAVLAEWWAGAGAGDDIKHMVMFTIGTGIGGGVISDDRLVRGATGMAGELGHTIIEPCIGTGTKGRLCAGTGVHGVLEQYCSARGMASRAKEMMYGKEETTASSLRELEDITAKEIFEHAASGDAFAQRVVDETAEYLAVGLINASRSFDPQLIVVTGGMTLAGDVLLDAINKHFLSRWWKIQPESTCRIALATTGNDAGVIGAAASARQALSTLSAN